MRPRALPPWPALPCALLVATAAPAQESGAPAEHPFAPARLRATLEWLAADERAGRDSPSLGLSESADWLAQRFEAAGLEPAGVDGSWFQPFSAGGKRLVHDGMQVVVHAGGEDLELDAGRDVRLWRATDAFESERGKVLRLDAAGVEPLRRRIRGRAPVLLEVPADGALWRAAQGGRTTLRGRGGGAPWLLVREGVLPGGEVTATVRVPAPAAVDVQLRNVLGRIPGSTRRDEAVVVSAHYDHIGVRPPRGGDAVYNGADDNGTGTTAVVALAEALGARQERLPRTVLFVAFAAEEKGLLGSRAFAGAPPVPLQDIVANVNIEMLGRPWRPATAWITGRTLSDFEAIAAAALARADIACEAFPQESMLFFASDNAALARRGVVAHTISASWLHEDYHGPGDEADRIDYENLAALLGGIQEVVVELASRPEPPAYNEAGRRTLRLDR